MTWTPVAGSAKSLLEGVEFGMTDGATTCRCFISQQEIDKWAGHIGKIDRHITFELFRRHESETCADETPFVDDDHRRGSLAVGHRALIGGIPRYIPTRRPNRPAILASSEIPGCCAPR